MHRLELILEEIKFTINPNKEIKNSKRGIAEEYFENYLNKWFKNRVYKNYEFSDIEYTRGYCPDFIIQEDSNLHIDIEIDEPYDFIGKKQIHYTVDNIHINTNRDSPFTNTCGWIVIRFAEEQVVRYPNECCRR